ncbi:MAG: phosphoenolpyruvate carboxylase, partial [Cyanobium sp.]
MAVTPVPNPVPDSPITTVPAALSETAPRVIRLLAERLELVEDLWQSVLRSECPPDRVERLLRLKRLSGPITPTELADESCVDTDGIVQLIREMDLADGIAAARAFSLYFQLVNIIEQHIEEDSYLESLRSAPQVVSSDPFVPPLARQSE